MRFRVLFFLLCFVFFVQPLTAVADDEITKIILSFVGDCTIGSTDRTRANENSFDSYIMKYGYDYPFKNVKELLSYDDLSVANLEGVFYDSELYKAKKNYLFRGSSEFAQILFKGGIDAVSIGNNHSADYGEPGVQQTIEALEKANVAYFGANEYARKTFIFEKDGIKIGFIGSYISYWWKNFGIIEDCFNELKQKGCEVIIASIHGGVEYGVRADSWIKDMASKFVTLGADIVIGHHPHIIQGIDVTEGKTIIYSLGNFCFGGNNNVEDHDTKYITARYTYIAQFTLSFVSSEYIGHQLNIIPALNSGTYPYNNYQPVLAYGKDAENIIKIIQRDTQFALTPYSINVGAVQSFIPANYK